MKINLLILNLFLLIFSPLWGAGAHAAPGAQIAPWSTGSLKDCTTQSKACSYKLNATINSKLWVYTNNTYPYEYSTISIKYLNNNDEAMVMAGHLRGEDALDVDITHNVNPKYIKNSASEIKKMLTGSNKAFSLTFRYPGRYVMTFCYSYHANDPLRNRAETPGYSPTRGCDINYYFDIEPSVSGLSFNAVNADSNNKISVENGTYKPPYTVKKLRITPEASNKQADINEIKSCRYTIPASDKGNVTTDKSNIIVKPDGDLAVKNENSIDAALSTLQLKPESVIRLNVKCTLSAKAYADYHKDVDATINIHRNKAQPGTPHFTLSSSNKADHSTTATHQYADWSSNTRYYIGVTTDHYNTLLPFDDCKINGKLHPYNGLSLQVNPSDIQSDHAARDDKNYQSYGGTRDYEGTCNIGTGDSSPYRYYPVKDIPIQNGFAITHYGPRIAQRSNFSGQFGEISLDNKNDEKVRPGVTFTLATSARLTGHPATGKGDFPNAIAQTTADSSLQSNQCLSSWKSTGSDGCRAGLTTIDQQGTWRLRADPDLMETTTANVYMTGSNHEGNFSSSYPLADKQITITPLLSLEGTFSPKSRSLTDKVYHHGSQFIVPASYVLKGRTKGKLNDRYRGKLTALKVTLDNNLAADKAGTATLEVAGQSVAKNKDWDGHTKTDFMASGDALLAHDQSSNLQIPLTVTRSSHEPAPAFATIKALGNFVGDNVDVVKEPTLQPGQFNIELGPDLYPAKEAYHMEVNNGELLTFSAGQKEPLTLKVNFNSLLAADKLATPEGIQATSMKITLPAGLQRAAEYPVQLFCNDGKACNSELNNSWDGKQHTDILQDHFLLKPGSSYSLSIPVMVSHDISAAPSPVTLTMSQNADIIDQDTRARIVSKDSTTTESKRVEKIARGEITIFPLEAKDQTLVEGNKMNITVAVKNGQQNDPITLQTGSSTIPLHFKDKQGDIARFTSEHPLSMPTEATYSLEAQLNTNTVLLAGPKLGDPRQLSCTLVNDTNLGCTFRWEAPLPYVSGQALLSYNALNNADKQLKENKKGGIMAMEPEEARQKLQDSLQDLESNGTWTDIQSFGNPSKPPRFTRPRGNNPEEQSLFEADKALPAKGTFEFN